MTCKTNTDKLHSATGLLKHTTCNTNTVKLLQHWASHKDSCRVLDIWSQGFFLPAYVCEHVHLFPHAELANQASLTILLVYKGFFKQGPSNDAPCSLPSLYPSQAAAG